MAESGDPELYESFFSVSPVGSVFMLFSVSSAVSVVGVNPEADCYPVFIFSSCPP